MLMQSPAPQYMPNPLAAERCQFMQQSELHRTLKEQSPNGRFEVKGHDDWLNFASVWDPAWVIKL